MSRSWLWVLGLMLVGSAILRFYPYMELMLLVNVGIVIGSYLILRRDPYTDLRANMLFILGLTVINVLSGIGLMSSMASNLAFVALLVWSMAGGGRSR